MKWLVVFSALFYIAYATECELKAVHRDCQDQTKECFKCMDLSSCRTECEADKECKGYQFNNQKLRCNLWYGKICGKENTDIKYYEKVCGGKPSIAPFDKRAAKDESDSKRNCPVSCSRLDLHDNIVHNLKHTNVGSKVTFYCRIGKLLGSRRIACGPDGYWSDEPPTCTTA